MPLPASLARRVSFAALLGATVLVAGTARANGVDPTKISLPSGPASVEGLGRNFTASLASGTASYGVDIAVPPAAGGFAPHLSLDYDGGSGVSELGVGWRLSGLPSIRRRTENGLPRFDATDTFELNGLGVPSDLLEMPDGYFRAAEESGGFFRVERSADGQTWEVRAKSGVVYRFGGDGFEESENGHVVTYLLREQIDLHNHHIQYAWDTSEGHALLTSVTWNDFGPSYRQQIALSYEVRPDTHTLFSSGIRQTITRRLHQLDVTLGGSLVRRYTLGFAPDRSLLASVEMFGTDGVTALPTLSLSYTQASFASDGQITAMTTPPGRSPADHDVTLADLNGDSLPDLLVTKAGAFRSYINQDGATWQAAQDWVTSDSPSVALSSTGVQLADLDGDGAIDLVVKNGTDSLRFFPGLDATHFAPSVAMTTVPNYTFEDPDVRLSDMDGDRRADAVITTEAGLALSYNLGGKDWTQPKTIGVIDSQQPLRFSDGKTQLCDVNGDRVEDFCYLRSGSLAYWLGRGRGVFEQPAAASDVPAFDDSDPWHLVDLNGDGWVDLVHVGGTQVDYALATGEGQFGAVGKIVGTPERGPNTTIEFADMNGSGTTDVVWIDVSGSPSTAWRYLELFPNGRAGLLETIDNGLGKLTRIEYVPAALSAAAARTAGKPWTTRMNVAMPVVSRIDVDDSLGDLALSTTFTYENGTWDPGERTFAGFGGGIQSELGDAYTPTLLTESTFDTGLAIRMLRGATLTSEQRDANGYLFGRSTSTYSPLAIGTAKNGHAIDYAYRSSERVEHIEGTDTTKERVTLAEFVDDSYGNPTEERRWGEVSGTDTSIGADEALVHRTFANNSDDWILGRLATEEVTDVSGTRVSASRDYYDGDAFTGLPVGQVSRGDITRQEEWIGPDPDAYQLEIATSYNSDGQPVETQDARGGGRYYEWNTDDHTTLVSEHVKLDGAVELTEYAETDPRFGDLLSVTEYNGQTLRFQYDALGRVTAIVKPGDAGDQPSVRFEYNLAAPLSRVATNTRVWSGREEWERTEQIFDGLGRKRASVTRDENERYVLAGVGLLDARGNARLAMRPRFVTASEEAAPPLLVEAPGSISWRDASGRIVRTRSEGGIETRQAYLPFVTQSWDGGQTDAQSPYEHLPVERAVDGLGRLVSATQYLGGAPLTATFRYDAAGRLLARTDPEANVSRYGYDGRGRRVTIDDPDLGKRILKYDETGNLIERDNPDGSKLLYGFDLAGRSITEDWDGDGKPEVVRHWDISPSAPGDLSFRGKLALVEEPTGKTEHQYDNRGRITNTTITIDGKAYASGSAYDNLDREYLHTYPDGSSVRLYRNPRGQLSGYGNAVSFSYDGDGLETERRFNTGVVQRYGYDADRRLDELSATATDGSVVEHLKWAFDRAGNVQSLTDLRAPISASDDRSEQYGYDNMYRLRSATGTWGKTSWAYSPSGNLTARTSTLVDQNVMTIAYGQTAGPHAMTQYGSRALSYDALGRLLDDGDRKYTWNSADQLTNVTAANGASVESRFDAEGVRRVRVERNSDGSTSTVLFISPWSEVKDGKLVRYVVHADRRIVRLSDTNGTGAVVAPVSARPASPPLALRIIASLAQSAIALALCVAFMWSQRRRLLKAVWIAAPVALAALSACRGDHASGGLEPQPIADGTVQTLGADDELLFLDQLGSVLSQTSGSGSATGRFAAYPFGVSRYSTISETRRYANAPRDTGVGLDLMGARFYAPDLGVWTIGDPALLNGPERGVGEHFGAANPYAYSNNNPVIAVDEDGNFWHIVAGAVIGAVIGGGIEAARQYVTDGKISDWGRVGAAAAGGAVSGAIQAALPGAGTAAVLGVGALSGAAAGSAERLVASGGRSAGSVTDVIVDAAIGAATAGVVKGGSVVVKKALGSIAKSPAVARTLTNVSRALARESAPPYGFKNPAQFRTAATELKSALAQHGVEDAQVGVRGSAVTGVGYSSGKPFGAHSDIDFFIESDAAVAGMPTSDKVPGMVKPRDIAAKYPAVADWAKSWSSNLGRDVGAAGFAGGAVPPGPQIKVEF